MSWFCNKSVQINVICCVDKLLERWEEDLEVGVGVGIEQHSITKLAGVFVGLFLILN